MEEEAGSALAKWLAKAKGAGKWVMDDLKDHPLSTGVAGAAGLGYGIHKAREHEEEEHPVKTLLKKYGLT